VKKENDVIFREFLIPQLTPKDYLDQIDFDATFDALCTEIANLRGFKAWAIRTRCGDKLELGSLMPAPGDKE
jgi:hypothetical protein